MNVILTLALITSLIAVALLCRENWTQRLQLDQKEDELEQGKDPGVDPWRLQRDLMNASDQRLPASPRVTNGSLLYLALMFEELGETSEAMANFLINEEFPLPEGINDIRAICSHMAMRLRSTSTLMRAKLQHAEEVDLILDPKAAKAIFDGTTDLAVVNAGFALASGFPGSEGYAEVVNSNLSKANPISGKIDKDASGKWIKGSNYQEPDLDLVLRIACPAWAHRHALAAAWPNDRIDIAAGFAGLGTRPSDPAA